MSSVSAAAARIILRNLPFHQSRNEVNIKYSKKGTLEIASLLKEDWFHVLLRRPTLLTMGCMLTVWTFIILIFAAIYQAVDNAYEFQDCGLSSSFGKLSFGGFFAFSLQTCTTVGYTLPGSTQAFFKNCPTMQFFIYSQIAVSIGFNAFLFSFFFARLARSESRGAQVIMSRTCCIRREGDSWFLEVRVHDTDAMHPIVEAHVRIYARRSSQAKDLVLLRTIYPNDDYGSMVFLSLPTIIRHEIDAYSALHPPSLQHHRNVRLSGSGLVLREADSRIGNVEQITCPVCSETYGDLDRLKAHVKYNQLTESFDMVPVEGSHQSVNLEDCQPPSLPSLQEMKNNFPDEILLITEGIDPLMSGTFQALQSYTLEDVSWGGHFAECVHTGKNATLTVNLKSFHTVEVDEEVLSDGVTNKQD